MERMLRSVDEGEAKDRWKSLHEKHAGSLLDVCLDMRGFYVKIGQVCSTRRDMFPGPWIDALEQLQGEHPELLARPVREMEGIIRKGLGLRARELVEVRQSALGAAATGQVHRARLRDGREVVVKVQYPDAERLYRLDFANTRLFCALLQPEHLPYLRELEAQFKTEFDYRREAADLAEIAARFAPGSGNPYAEKVRIPAPVPELAARNVVVMEYLPGETLLGYARRRKRQLEDSSFLSYLWQGFWLRRELRAHLRVLIGVQGHQIFVDGVFNGDPHPGNILLMPDGRLGLIDYGNVKRLTAQQRAQIGRLFIALAGGKRDEVAAAAEVVGFRTRSGDRECLFRFARLWFDRDDDETLVMPDGSRPANIQLYMEKLSAIDPLIKTPDDFLMVARNSFLLRGLGTHFGVRLHMGAEWKALAESAARQVGSYWCRRPASGGAASEPGSWPRQARPKVCCVGCHLPRPCFLRFAPRARISLPGAHGLRHLTVIP
ncbi:unnamed protein product, partial [Prorocentrum cordatum]